MKEIKNSKQNKDQNTKKGFTLIETLVAIFILVLSVTGPMSAAQNSLKASFLARDQISAFYLAQDAIEFLRNEKDTNMILKITSPSQTILNPTIMSNCTDNPCTIDTTDNSGILNAVKTCPPGACDPLYFDEEEKKYVTENGPNRILSKFTREVYIKDGGKPTVEDEYIVTVVIRWQPNFLSERRIVVQENIYNWLSIN